MLEDSVVALELLRCPRTLLPLRSAAEDTLVTATEDPNDQYTYRVVAGIPILVDFESSVLDEGAVLESLAASPVDRRVYEGLALTFKNYCH